MILYKTIKNESVAEQIIEKSRFITYVKPVDSKDEADEYIKQIKKEHKSATHNVPAMVIGDKFQVQWASDDGEPQGTAGAPIVKMLVNEGITNVVVVVTRYFGGIKLGTGGLVRAYTSSAKLGIEAGELCQVKEVYSIEVRVDYKYLSIFESLQQERDYQITDKTFAEKVVLTLSFDIENLENIKKMLNEIMNGNVEILKEKEDIAMMQ